MEKVTKLPEGAVFIGKVPAGFEIRRNPTNAFGYVAVHPDYEPLVIDAGGVRPMFPADPRDSTR